MHTKRMPQHPLFNDINKNQRTHISFKLKKHANELTYEMTCGKSSAKV